MGWGWGMKQVSSPVGVSVRGSFPISGPGAASAQTKPARLGEKRVQAPLLAPQGFSAPVLGVQQPCG